MSEGIRARILMAILMAFPLVGCYEPAAKWDDRRGRFISTDQLENERRQEIKSIERRLDTLEKRR